ncbi:hypothetical protein IFM89_020166 [Coptis chinensis]|uniref:RNase H type-1 domain-containing protein n=1 Tax=Coptis chinensis TaxID=261450 RepID=A0A835H7F7_9MAGN|nr:hypothetical protein IFM89_020166 [Coptis chinensis]
MSSLCIRTDAANFMVYEWLHMCLNIKKSPDIDNLCSPMLFCAIMHAIWKARNNKMFNGGTTSQQSILQQAYRVCQYWIVAFIEPDSGNEDSDSGDGASLSSYQSWVKPPPGWCKINFDASFHSDCAHTNIAVVGRNSEGEFLGGKVGRVRANSPGEAEALVAELAVDFALQK